MSGIFTCPSINYDHILTDFSNATLTSLYSFQKKVVCNITVFRYCNHKWTSSGAQWLSGRVLDSRPKGSGFEPHRRHCVVVLEQDTIIGLRL